MAQPAQTLIERAEVHKSCRALEAVVNLFNDYCQAAAAAAQVEKRLAKALRDAANCKATSEPPFNALSATAVVFETLSDIDNKFSKIVDKECDNVSGDLRKWFKKLAKEEKAHDDRIQAVNAKIKAAGQAYEKKSKKKAADAVEEHSRYMNLLTAVGPEMAQDKQNHATFVTQRHNAAVCNIAASLARAADAEWSRACEGVRRVAPNIGNVTEWRAYCEGEWAGPIPADLPNFDAQEAQPESYAYVNVQAALHTGTPRAEKGSQPESPVTTRDTSSSAPSFNQPPPQPPQEPLQPPSFPSFPRPQTPESTPTLSRAQTFADTLPVPPSLPPAAASAPPSPSLAPPSAPAAKPPASPATLNRRVSDGPPMPAPPPPAPSAAKDSAPTSTIPEDDKPPPVTSVVSDKPPQVGLGLEKTLTAPQSFSNHTPFASDRTLLDSPAPKSPPPRGDYLQDRKVSPGGARPLPSVERQMTGVGTGIHQIQAQPTGMVAPQGTGPQPGGVHRRTSVDSTASGSIVAAMRDRYGDRGMPAPASPTPRDMPRLPHSVTDMASRWSPIDAPAPRRAGVNPAQSLERDSFRMPESPRNATGGRPQSVYSQQLNQVPAPYGRGGDSDWERERDTERRRQHLQQELQALEHEQRQEDELRERERALARQQAELEKERQRLATIRGSSDETYGARSRQNSYNSGVVGGPSAYMRPPSANGSAYGARDPSPHRETYPSYTSSASASSSAHLAAPARPGFGPYDGASEGGRYSNPPSPSRSNAALPLQTPTGSVASKKGGWMRRLSMPVVGGAFSDTKKTPLASPPDDRGVGKRSFDKDGVGNFGHRRDNYANANSSLTRR